MKTIDLKKATSVNEVAFLKIIYILIRNVI